MAARQKCVTGAVQEPPPCQTWKQSSCSLGLSGTADPAALHRNLRKLPGVRQQGVLDNAAAVAAHLRSPAVGLTAQQVGQLLERCPRLFSWSPEQRAAVLFGQLLGAGLTAAEAAQCFVMFQYAANCTTLAAGLAELAAILARSEDRDSSLGGRTAKVPAAQRTVAALLSQTPSAVKLVGQRAGHLQQHAAELQQAGLTAAEVAALVWKVPELLSTDTAGRVASRAAVLQQELGLPAAGVVALVVKGKPGWLTSSVATLRERAAALAEVSKCVLGLLLVSVWLFVEVCAMQPGQTTTCPLCLFSNTIQMLSTIHPPRNHCVAGLRSNRGSRHAVQEPLGTCLRPYRVAPQPVLHGGLRRSGPHGSAAAVPPAAAL